jgi:glutamate-1-semialdehyde aminotransferase
VWTGDKTYIAIFCEQAYKRGILLHPGAWWISFSHTDDILKMELNILKELIENIEGKNIQLSGLATEPVFKRL